MENMKQDYYEVTGNVALNLMKAHKLEDFI